MDSVDLQIVELLRQNARRSLADIGGRVSLSPPAVKRRIDRLETAGILEGYTARVNAAAMGWETHAFVALFCDGRMDADDVRAVVEPHPEVVAAHTVAGEASAILQVRAADTRHLESALARIRDAPGVVRTHTQVVLSTLLERPVH